MTLADVTDVSSIDRLSFDIPWSKSSYDYEITDSEHSHMVVLEYRKQDEMPFWQRWLGWEEPVTRHIVGYGGLWNVGGEAHISTIAVHPRGRGRGWGEILLAGMIQRSITLRASEVVLEVRVSNDRAQNLYRKYEFETERILDAYYRNNNEDAYEMHLHLESEATARFQRRYADLLTRRPFSNEYSTVPRPPVKRQGFF
jgi:[ribosomal protein S18]-alanine N-acetyltransferase